MKKWLILGVFAVLYAWAMYVFLAHLQKGRRQRPSDATAPTSTPAMARPHLNPPSSGVQQIKINRDSDISAMEATNLPYSDVAATFLVYADLDKVIPKKEPLLVIHSREWYAPLNKPEEALQTRRPEIKGTIQLNVPGKAPLSVKFDSETAQQQAPEPAGAHAPAPSLEGVFKKTFPPKMAELVGRSAGPVILVPALMSGDAMVRKAAEKALLAIADSNTPDIKLAEVMADLLESEDPVLRDIAVRVLGSMTDPKVAPLLVAVLTDPSPEVRASALEALGKIRDLRAMEPVMASAKDGSAAVRLQAIRALGSMAHAQSVKTLIPALSDESPEVQQAAAAALKKIHDPGTANQLLALASQSNGPAQRIIIQALGDTENPAAIDYLFAALNSPQADIRDAAVEALGKMRDSKTIEPLAKALHDPDIFVRSGAAASLSQINDRRVIPPLIGALSDDGLIQLSVGMSLKRLTGREFGTNTAAWTAWWNNVQHDGSFHLPFEEAALQTNAPIESVEEEEPEETVEGPVAWPSLHLAGVLRGTARRKGAAVINNQIVREEDRVEGVLLAAVREDSVTLKYHGQTRVLRVNESIRE